MPRAETAGAAAPGDRAADTHNRACTDIIDKTSCLTLRHAGWLYYIGNCRTRAQTHVILLSQDLHIRIINAATGELLREFTLADIRTVNERSLGL